MKIEQLQQLLKIVEKGSMNEAARELYLSRSSLSTSMKKLELELGEPIFDRHSRGVGLTPFGASVYAEACEICSRVGLLRSISRQGGAADRLAIASMYCSMANDAFAVYLSRHYKDRLHASIEESPLSAVIQSVSTGLCEIGIVTIFGGSSTVVQRKLEEGGLEFHALAQRRLGAIVGPKNPLFYADADSVDMQELGQYPHLENYATPTDHSWEHLYVPNDTYRAHYLMSDLGLALRTVMETDAVMLDAYDKDVYDSLYAHSGYRFLPIRDYPLCSTGWVKRKYAPLSSAAAEYLAILAENAEKAT